MKIITAKYAKSIADNYAETKPERILQALYKGIEVSAQNGKTKLIEGFLNEEPIANYVKSHLESHGFTVEIERDTNFYYMSSITISWGVI